MDFATFVQLAKNITQDGQEKHDFKEELRAFMRTGQEPLKLACVYVAAKQEVVRY